ncbi:MAG: ribonuclease H-like domain-containing protein [Bdellovibrionales bacterium]|nr:ribonuclease H-like domain-containing protein [Bdellovibrionales bacterium]
MSSQFDLFSQPQEKNSEPRILYFDLETLRSADEVGGWSNIKGMGMACGVCFDTKDKEYKVFRESEVQDLIDLLRCADLVVGFNHIRFDYEVLRGYSAFDFNLLPSFDMLVDLKERLGHRIKLDSLAKATLGQQKSADGLQSLRWVKEGKMDQVIEYCKQDVKVTKNVFEYGRDHEHVIVDKMGSPSKIRVEWRVDDIVKQLHAA